MGVSAVMLVRRGLRSRAFTRASSPSLPAHEIPTDQFTTSRMFIAIEVANNIGSLNPKFESLTLCWSRLLRKCRAA